MQIEALTSGERSFMMRMQVGADTECWHWHGPTRNGAPVFYDAEKHVQVYARRWAFENWRESIPVSARLRNNRDKCVAGSRRCVNPFHYEVEYSEPDTSSVAQAVAKHTGGTVLPSAKLAEAQKLFLELETASPVL